jgi:flavin-dependent dehydrogenase
MAKQKYDVVIVGGSFGGCVAGKVAAEKGLNALIVERAQVPGEKVISGAGMSTMVFQELPWLMEGPLEQPVTGFITHFLKHGQVQTTVKVQHQVPDSYTIYCRPFITWMAEQAVKAGAKLMTSTVATDVIKEKGFIKGILTDAGEEIRSDIVIAADGMWSLIGIKAGIRQKIAAEDIMHGLWLDFVMPSKQDLDKALEGDNAMIWWDPAGEMLSPHGIVGYFGVGPYNGSFHFGMGTVLTHVARKRIDYDQLYEQFFQHDYWKERFGKAKLRCRMWRPYPVYAGLDMDLKGNDRTYGNGIMIVGDAACFEATATGLGIHTAMISGKIAAGVAADAIGEGDPSAAFLKKYEELWRSSIIGQSIKERARRDLTRYAGDEAQMKRHILDVYVMPYIQAVF